MLGRTVSAVKNKRFEIGAVRCRQKPSLEEVKKLARAGMTKREISKTIGISISAVNWYLYHYGIDYVKCDGSYVWRNDMRRLFGGSR
ncbi:TPA: winged helix-turn-helix transcriptional regulator [Streptococcus suis]|nr:winged helix-turn-helix transcriptional regulator [Streptococcus suis]